MCYVFTSVQESKEAQVSLTFPLLAPIPNPRFHSQGSTELLDLHTMRWFDS